MAEVLHGKATGDNLAVSANKTQVYGLVGNDTLTSDGKSNVLLIGGSGNDRLIMTGGDGTLSGGAGNDTFEFTYSADKKISAVIEDVDPSNDKIFVNFAGDGTPKLSSVASGDDVIWTDSDGYFNLTLKGSSDASDYFDGTASDNVWEVLRLTNNEREKQNLPWYTLSQGLTDGASIRATEIVDEFGHTRPDGTPCFTVLTKSYWTSGENAAEGYTSASEVVTGWMNSTGHRANILNSDFKKLGVGYTYDADSEMKHYWIQMFGGNLTSPDTLSTAELLSAKIEVGTVSAQATDTTPADTTPADTAPADTTTADTTPANPKLITLTEGNDSIENTLSGATIQALGGNDTIRNLGTYTEYDSTGKSSVTIRGGSVQIDGGAGNDSISNGGDKVTVYGGDGNDRISNYGDNTTVYAGDGNDSFIIGGEKVAFFGEAGNDNFFGSNWSAQITTVDGGDGNDTVEVFGQSLLIYGGDGKDSIEILGEIDGSTGKLYVGHITIDAGAGDDVLTVGSNWGEADDYYASISLGDGNDNLEVNGNYVTVKGGKGNDKVSLNYGKNNLIQYTAGDGNDTIDYLDGNDTLSISGGSYTTQTSGNNVIVKVGDGSITLKDAKDLTLNIKGTLDTTKGGSSSTSTTQGGGSSTGGGSTDTTPAETPTTLLTVTNSTTSPVTVGSAIRVINATSRTSAVQITGNASANTIRGGSGNDTLSGGAGNDSIFGAGGNDVLNGDAGNDTLTGGAGNDSLTGGNGNDIFIYDGNGSDVITDYATGDQIRLSDGTISNASLSGSDVILRIGGNTLTVKDGRDKSLTWIDTNNTSHTTLLTASSTSGGSSSSTTRGGSSSTSTTRSGSSSTSTSKSGSSSASADWDKLFSTTSSSSTSTGTRSTSTTSSSSTSTGTRSTSTTSSSSTSTGIRSTSTTSGGGSTSTTNQNVYTGGDKVISNYLGQPITIGAYTGATFDDSGNFFVGSPTGTLVIQNVADKIVDLRDGAGNAFIKAYTPSTAGVIDLRGLAGYEIISGAANGTDVIFAGDGGSQLWGGSGLDADALVGGNGSDIFVGGRFQGFDNIFNASSADTVNLTDATLSDIVATVGGDGNISIGFNTNSVINIQSTELLSAAINLADGSSWRFNHATKAWQSA